MVQEGDFVYFGHWIKEEPGRCAESKQEGERRAEEKKERERETLHKEFSNEVPANLVKLSAEQISFKVIN